MALTRAQVEEILINRLGGWLRAAGLDHLTFNGANGDLNDPIGRAIRLAGGTVANPVAVVDADLGAIALADYDKLFDLAELRTLVTISQHLTTVDLTIGPKTERFDQLARRIMDEIKRKREEVENDHGIGGSVLEAGVITDLFASHNEEPVA